MPYCSSDGKLAGYDEPEFEINSEEVSEPSTNDEATTSVTVSLAVQCNWPCASCGTTSKTGELEMEVEVEHTCDLEGDDDDEVESDFAGREFTLQIDDDITYEDSGGGRYKKALQGATVTGGVTCSRCDGTESWSVTETQAASYYETEAH